MGTKLALAAVAALLLAGCGASDPQVSAPATTSPNTQGLAASGLEIAGIGVEGEALDLADFRGKPVFVNVWSSW